VLRALHADATWSRAAHPLLHPGKAASVEAGAVGEVHPALVEGTWGAFELDLERLADAARDPVGYEDVITYPAVREDIAVAVDEDVEVGALVEAAREAAGPMLREARVFDVYRGEQVGDGRKSVAVHLAFQSPEKTLTDEEAAELRGEIIAVLTERFGAELRA
jgi:phenylalanyl-tRNA synthetase beta chain